MSDDRCQTSSLVFASRVRGWNRVAIPRKEERLMLIDCGTCQVRGAACEDCVVTALLGPPTELELDDVEQAAVSALAEGGLIPPLRLVPMVTQREPEATQCRHRIG